ncbi:basement membrane-specific heparan sulfate proteoglycan core protein-like [Garra rufa]|uniref:basement membrane-specific heparan sulfate proteoglycan core protein-like n=1 Tax=Garra rufa TaxID=137080 RepID=UPI003CCE5A6C
MGMLRNGLTNDQRYDWTPEWRYEWYKGTDSVMLQKSDRYTVSRDTLTIRAEFDLGQYWCRGQRDKRPNSSQSSSAVSLIVKDLPTSTLTMTPDSPVFSGETVNLTCVIESDHSDWRYEWYKGTNNSVMLQTTERYTVSKNTLIIRGATESDQDQYWCRGQRDGRPKLSQKSNRINLSVNVLMSFIHAGLTQGASTLTVTPDNTVFTGETVILTCVIKYYNNWRYEWFKENRYLQITDRYTVKGNTLTIIAATKSDAGQYWCRRSVSSNSVSLIVKGELNIIILLNFLYMRMRFNCETESISS